VISDADRSRMLEAATTAAARAYAPYSGFRVGAAVLADDGAVYAGCNVENGSYGLTICAERNAVFRAVAASPRPLALRGILVYTLTTSPTAPCGACRQVLHEFGPRCDVLCLCDGADQIVTTLDKLLPGAFDLPPPG
jgi:cytidine deaminase